MANPKSVESLEVHQNRRLIGHLSRTKSGAEFTYTPEALADPLPAAANLPKSGQPIRVEGSVNLPSFFANLLPEGVVQDAVVRTYRLSRDDLFSQLAITASDAIGDITVHVPGLPPPPPNTSVRQAVQSLKSLQALQSTTPINALPGVQPKLSIGQQIASSRGTIAIVKVPPPQYPGILENELAVMRLARRAGLRTPNTRLNQGCLVVTRFDRIKRPNNKPTQIHVEDALQILNLYPLAKYSLDFTEILEAAARLGMAKAVLIDLLRLYIFSYTVGNSDLHGKNVSFLRLPDSNLWTMAPAYDLLCTLPYEPDPDFGPRMALALGEQWGGFLPDEILEVARQFELPEKPVLNILEKVSTTVLQAIGNREIPVTDEILLQLKPRSQNLRP